MLRSTGLKGTKLKRILKKNKKTTKKKQGTTSLRYNPGRVIRKGAQHHIFYFLCTNLAHLSDALLHLCVINN